MDICQSYVVDCLLLILTQAELTWRRGQNMHEHGGKHEGQKWAAFAAHFEANNADYFLSFFKSAGVK